MQAGGTCRMEHATQPGQLGQSETGVVRKQGFQGLFLILTQGINQGLGGMCAVTGSDQDHLLPIYKNVPAMQGLMGFQIEHLEMMQKVNGGGSWRVL